MRPSKVAADLAASVAKVEGVDTHRLVMVISPTTLRALKIRAVTQGLTQKAYVLGLIAADGVAVDPRDLAPAT